MFRENLRNLKSVITSLFFKRFSSSFTVLLENVYSFFWNSYRCFQKCFVKICETSKCHNFLIFSSDFHQVFSVLLENFTLSSEIKFNLFRFWAPFHKKIKVDSLASLGRNATLITSMAACYPIKIVFHKTSILEWQAAIAEISDLFITRFHCKARMATWHMFPLWRKFPQFREILIIPG